MKTTKKPKRRKTNSPALKKCDCGAKPELFSTNRGHCNVVMCDCGNETMAMPTALAAIKEWNSYR
jgi:hypothetical protein